MIMSIPTLSVMAMLSYSSKPGIVSDKGCCRSSKCAPPQAAYAICLGTLAEQSCSANALHLKGSLQGIDRSEYHAKSCSTSIMSRSDFQRDRN